jgi:hypothetical protein
MYDHNMTLHQILLRYQMKYCGRVECVAEISKDAQRVIVEEPERRPQETGTL